MTTIELDHVAKIEGHAKLNISIENNELMSLDLEIFEGARFFENILKGKKYNELPLITSRICGVCSPNHSLTAISAIEEAFEIVPSGETNLLRELLAIGGLLQSHALHLYFLILPDYKGYESAISMMPDHKDEIDRALRIKRMGNSLVSTIGGRDIHPLTALVGGFSKVPSSEDLNSLIGGLDATYNDALKSFELFSQLPFPEFQHRSTYMAMHGKHLLGDSISYLENGTLNHFPHDYETYITGTDECELGEPGQGTKRSYKSLASFPLTFFKYHIPELRDLKRY
jgi:coenzyme F420-reducing hydrogenase alpha subunit